MAFEEGTQAQWLHDFRHDDLASLPAVRAREVAERCFPNRPLTIVPLALALATIMQSAEDAILVATNVGGDSDS